MQHIKLDKVVWIIISFSYMCSLCNKVDIILYVVNVNDELSNNDGIHQSCRKVWDQMYI